MRMFLGASQLSQLALQSQWTLAPVSSACIFETSDGSGVPDCLEVQCLLNGRRSTLPNVCCI